MSLMLPLDEGARVINTLCKNIITPDFVSGDNFFPRVLIYPNTFIQGQYVYNTLRFYFPYLSLLFNYESNVFRYYTILIDCVFGNSKFVVPSTLTIDRGEAEVNIQCLGDNKLAIPSYLD
jgi:hypothetical protein